MSFTRRASCSSELSASYTSFANSLRSCLFSSSKEVTFLCNISRLMPRKPVGVPASELDSSTSFVSICINSVFFNTSWFNWVIFSFASLSSVSNAFTVVSSFWLCASNSLPMRAVSSKSFSFCRRKPWLFIFSNYYNSGRSIIIANPNIVKLSLIIFFARKAYFISECYVKGFSKKNCS